MYFIGILYHYSTFFQTRLKYLVVGISDLTSFLVHSQSNWLLCLHSAYENWDIFLMLCLSRAFHSWKIAAIRYFYYVNIFELSSKALRSISQSAKQEVLSYVLFFFFQGVALQLKNCGMMIWLFLHSLDL